MTKKTKDELQVRYREIQDRMGELNVTAAEGKREAEAAEQAKRDSEQKALDEAEQRARELQLMRMKFNF